MSGRPPSCSIRAHGRRGASSTEPSVAASNQGGRALGAYGGLALGARTSLQRPTAAAIRCAVAFGVANLIATSVARRATTGFTGRTRQRPADIAVMALVWVGVFVVMGVLIGAGASHAIVYGLYPAAEPLIVAGLAWAAIMASRADWRACGSGREAAAVGAVATAAGTGPSMARRRCRHSSCSLSTPPKSSGGSA